MGIKYLALTAALSIAATSATSTDLGDILDIDIGSDGATVDVSLGGADANVSLGGSGADASVGLGGSGVDVSVGLGSEGGSNPPGTTPNPGDPGDVAFALATGNYTLLVGNMMYSSDGEMLGEVVQYRGTEGTLLLLDVALTLSLASATRPSW